MITRLIKYSSVIALYALIDQISKAYFISFLKTKKNFVLEIFPFLDFVYAWNYGISFGLFQQYYQYSNYILLVLNTFIIIYLFIFLAKSKSRLSIYSMQLNLGGAIGNLIDRGVRGAVFDFIYFNYKNIDFPAFNLADSFISIGVILFIYDYIFTKKSVAENI